MRLLVQSDDFGITPGVSAGIIYGIRHGIIRNTGLFANMPDAEESVEMIRPYLDRIAFGIDLNASAGPSLLPHGKIPHLTHEDGTFLTSRENRALDTEENGFDHVSYDETYAEFDAQIRRFTGIVGKKPDYLHRHAYMTKTTDRIIHDLALKYGIIDSQNVMDSELIKMPRKMDWMHFGSADAQLESNLEAFILEDKGGLLGADTAMLVAHCGFADVRITQLSSFNLLRLTDLEAMISERTAQWIRDNNIELITYKDLDERFMPQ
ncbi:MAG: ChbG/HpnK family deacetylase [Solobacterium sp.]|nr:ChbG/HpnK family deacetylase [Solobacterium sp.]